MSGSFYFEKIDLYVKKLKYMRSTLKRCAFYYENFFGFEGSYAKVTEGVKNDLTINSKEFLYQMKSLAKNSEGIPSDYFEQYYKEIKNIKPKDLPIYGVVVTGKTEDLQGLQGAPYIKAAVRGVTVEKY